MNRDKGSAERSLLPAIWNDNLEDPALKKMLHYNQVIKHNYRHEVKKSYPCALEGCSNVFEITLIPKQVLYPKFCEKHRSEYQRSKTRNKK